MKNETEKSNRNYNFLIKFNFLKIDKNDTKAKKFKKVKNILKECAIKKMFID